VDLAALGPATLREDFALSASLCADFALSAALCADFALSASLDDAVGELSVEFLDPLL